MRNNRLIIIVFVFILAYIIGCGKTEKQRLSPSARSMLTDNKYQTVVESPAENFIVENNNKLPITSGPTEEINCQEMCPCPDAQLSLPIDGAPLTAPGVPGHGEPIAPPIPTDDDLLIDELLPPHIGTFGLCGNGVRELREHCDDGNDDNMDGCNVLCQFPYCGNGVREHGEECDDGPTENVTGCSDDCHFERCGNGRLDPGEDCDDGNTEPADGCSPCCKYERCGNEIVDPGEECDDGNTENDDGCDDCCQLEPGACDD